MTIGMATGKGDKEIAQCRIAIVQHGMLNEAGR
jgi:hypothetical protein